MSNQTVQLWLERAQYDLESARTMLSGGRYLYVVFMCQQAIEKLLKGIIHQATGKLPPYTHNLVGLATSLPIECTEEQLDFFALLTRYYLNTRYPDSKQQLASQLDEERAKDILRKSEEMFVWLKKKSKI